MRIKLRFALLCVVLLAMRGASAQQSETVPVVISVSDVSGAEIPGAYVRIIPAPGSTAATNVDSNGHLALKMKPGSYALFVRSQAFRPIATHFDVRNANETQTVSVVLQIGTSGGVEVEVAGAKDGLAFYLYPYHQPTRLSIAEIKGMAHVSVTIHNSHASADETYSGVRLSDILGSLGAPLGKELRGEALTNYIVATGSDGYQAVLSLGEIDPAFHTGEVIVADTMSGKPLGEHDGPLKLVVSEDKRPARAVRNLTTITLQSAR